MHYFSYFSILLRGATLNSISMFIYRCRILGVPQKVKKFKKNIQPWHLFGFSMETVFWFLKTAFSLIFNGNCFCFLFSFEKVICSENQCKSKMFFKKEIRCREIALTLLFLELRVHILRCCRYGAISRHPISFLKKHFRFALIFRTNDFSERKEKQKTVSIENQWKCGF